MTYIHIQNKNSLVFFDLFQPFKRMIKGTKKNKLQFDVLFFSFEMIHFTFYFLFVIKFVVRLQFNINIIFFFHLLACVICRVCH